MKTAKEITITGVFVALLIALQWALSVLPSVELVSVFSAVFCYSFGVKKGVIAMTAFSLLRCFVFGFFPTAMLLYLVYYNLFAVCFGFLGNKMRKKEGAGTHLWVILLVILITPCFTLLDNLITPLVLGFSKNAAKIYFASSLPFMATQTVCAALTTALLFYPLRKVFKSVSE